MLAFPKNPPIFAPEFLTVNSSYSAFIEAAFFVSARNSDSIGCCTPSGSRFIALLTSSHVRDQQSFFIHSFLIRQMNSSVKNASKVKHSTLTSTPRGARSARIPALTVRTGIVNRPNLILGELLNFVDNATQRQIKIIYNACCQRMTGQMINGKVRRVAV